MVKKSEKLKLNKEDMTKLGKSFLISLGGFVIAFGTDTIPNIDFGQFSTMVYALSPVIANLIRKVLSGK